MTYTESFGSQLVTARFWQVLKAEPPSQCPGFPFISQLTSSPERDTVASPSHSSDVNHFSACVAASSLPSLLPSPRFLWLSQLSVTSPMAHTSSFYDHVRAQHRSLQKPDWFHTSLSECCILAMASRSYPIPFHDISDLGSHHVVRTCSRHIWAEEVLENIINK